MNIEKSVAGNEASVSRLAYQLWENAGRPAGRDLEFWLAAEAQVRTLAMSRHNPVAPQSKIAEVADKPSRASRPGVKKSWPKPYPSLPKF
ncbi:MAG TPA: DUF2934 domain-containing protein [Verrucomicrobiae bacterium]|nr:DUF2934 domain-containing protein [Verrucomicrobiae bacterium]